MMTLPKGLDRTRGSGLLRPIAIAACLAGIVHITATFAMPIFAGQTPYHRLTASLPLNTLALFPTVTPASQPLPYMAPDARYAMCRYDTGSGPLAVDVTLPDAGWLLALYAPSGDNFYYVAGQADRATRLSLLLVAPGDQPVVTDAADMPQREGVQSLVPTDRGLVVVRAPARGAAYDQEIEKALRKTRCTQLQRRAP